MQRERETNGLGGLRTALPDARLFIEAQRTATENACRMANAAYKYAFSVNRAWLDLWGNRLPEYLARPKRFADMQTDFFERAFDHYQESMQKFGGLAKEAKDQAETAVKEGQAAVERAVSQFQQRPGPGNAGEHREGEPQHVSH